MRWSSLRQLLPSTPYKIGDISFEALGDRLIIIEDAFRSGYECTYCDGKGSVICDCGGSGFAPYNPSMTCNQCGGKGTVVCQQCQGKGGLLVAPETAQRRPTTGKIVSAGPGVKFLRVGDSILYSNFAGYVMDINGTVIRLLHEPEALSKVQGHLTAKRGHREMPDSFDSTNAMSTDKAFK